jgi:type IV pilus assembly protein PilP
MNKTTHFSMLTIKAAAAALLAIALLSGCAAGVDDELTGYIAEVRARPGGRIKPLPQINPYVAFKYQALEENVRSPFQPDRLNEAPRTAGPKPARNRNKEYLEQFPLDTLAMVGTLDRQGRTFGLVQTTDGMVHRVIAGNYVGQNDGQILGIDGAGIELEEIVPDGIGGFYKRPAEIGLKD